MTKKRKKSIHPNLIKTAPGKPPNFFPRVKIEWTALKQNLKLPALSEDKLS
jgi:hypothetical protein